MTVTALPQNFTEKPPKTTLAARLDEPMRAGRNVIWCATFQLCWNALGTLFKGDPRLSGTPDLEKSLNAHHIGTAEVDMADCVAEAGLGGDRIVERIQEQLNQKFGEAADTSLLPDDLEPENILAYAFLKRTLEFATPFELSRTPHEFLGSQVDTFGIGIGSPTDGLEEERHRQVSVLHYGDEDEYAVELHAKDQTDRLILAKTLPRRTLMETVDAAISRLRAGSELGVEDILIIPKPDYDVTRDFPEIEGRSVLNPGFDRYRVAKALKNVRFRLDEKGAVLKSEALIEMVLGEPATRPRVYNFCRPHLVMLLRRDARRPYFAMWVDNAELLIPAG